MEHKSSTVAFKEYKLKGLRTQVDPHWERGQRIRADRRLTTTRGHSPSRYLKIGIRWLKGVLNKGRDLFSPAPLFSQNIQPCFASKKAKQKYYDAIWFTRISEVKCVII